jgi:hypothetical protein
MTLDPADWGPLPSIDRNAEIEALSIQAVERLFDPSRFVVRREARDYGVDLSLEVRTGASPLNLRAQAQIKGTDKPKRLKDDTITFDAETSNLNYF